MPPSDDEHRPRYVSAYTVCLYVIGGLALMMVFSHQLVVEFLEEEEEDHVLMVVLRFVQAIEVIVFVYAVTVATLRAKNSPLAAPTTTALSILLVFWPPWGTAVFIWWVGWVRRRERVVSSQLASGESAGVS